MPWTKDECSPIRLQRNKRPLNEKMQSRLNRLIEMGIVEHIGRKKYILARSLYAATGKTGVHTRHVGLDRDTNKELLLKHIRQNNEVGTPFKELQQVLPGLDRNQIRVLMRELRESGKVFCEGTTSAARWFASKYSKILTNLGTNLELTWDQL